MNALSYFVPQDTAHSQTHFDAVIGQCKFTNESETFVSMALLKAYNMAFDGIIVLLNVFKIGFDFDNHGPLARVLQKQSSVYFVAA